MLFFEELIVRGDFARVELPWVEHRIATSATGAAYRAAYAWILASLGRESEARAGTSQRPSPAASRRYRSTPTGSPESPRQGRPHCCSPTATPLRTY